MLGLEEFGPEIVHRWYDESPVQEVILLLARRLRNEQAAVTRGSMEETGLMLAGRLVLGAHGIVRAEPTDFQRCLKVPMNLATGLDEPSERSFRIGRARVKEDAKSGLERVNPFANGTGRIAAFQRNRRQQHVGDRMKQVVRQAGKCTSALGVQLLPDVEAGKKLSPALLHLWPLQPLLHDIVPELNENPFSSIFHGREP